MSYMCIYDFSSNVFCITQYIKLYIEFDPEL